MNPQVLLSEHGRLRSVPDTGSRSGFFSTWNPHLLITSVFTHKSSSGFPRYNPLTFTRPFLFSGANARVTESPQFHYKLWPWFTCCDHTVSQLDCAPVPDSAALRGMEVGIRHQALARQRTAPRHCHRDSRRHCRHPGEATGRAMQPRLSGNTAFSAPDFRTMVFKIAEASHFTTMFWIIPRDLH